MIRIKSNHCISPTTWHIRQRPGSFVPDTCGGSPILFNDGHQKFALVWHFMGGAAEEVHAWIGETKLPSGYVSEEILSE